MGRRLIDYREDIFALRDVEMHIGKTLADIQLIHDASTANIVDIGGDNARTLGNQAAHDTFPASVRTTGYKDTLTI
jgi:hypothetical protein